MGLQQRVRLELEDGTVIEPVYDGRDIRAWEAKYGQGAIGRKTTLSMLAFYGWSAAKREGLLNGEYDRFEAFDKVCTWVEFAPDAEDEDAEEESAAAGDDDGEPPDPSMPPAPSPDTPREASGE